MHVRHLFSKMDLLPACFRIKWQSCLWWQQRVYTATILSGLAITPPQQSSPHPLEYEHSWGKIVPCMFSAWRAFLACLHMLISHFSGFLQWYFLPTQIITLVTGFFSVLPQPIYVDISIHWVDWCQSCTVNIVVALWNLNWETGWITGGK